MAPQAPYPVPPAADWRRLLPSLTRMRGDRRFLFELLTEPAPVPRLQPFRPARRWGL